MRDFRDSKTMARALRRALQAHDLPVTHSQSLELMAKAFGYDNWNILAAKIEASRPQAAAPAKGGHPMHCSFCGKAQQQVAVLIAGPSVAVCSECVRLCDDILDDHDVMQWLQDEDGPDARLAARSADELRGYLERARKSIAEERELIRAVDDDPGALPPFLKDLSPAELKRRRGYVAHTLAKRLTSIDQVEAALRARE